MKTIYPIYKPVLRLFSVFLLALLVVSGLHAQTYYLKDIVLGNRYVPNSQDFCYETQYDYAYCIKNNRVDSRGGDLELHVWLKTRPECKKVYQVRWSFNKDIRTVSCGEKILVDIVNQPVSGGDCGWDWVFHNPSSFSLLNGASGMTYAEAKKDPGYSYREYVFLHYPGHKVNGEPQFIDHKFTHLHHAEQLEIVVCSRKEMAIHAHGGNFHFNFDGRGLFFDIDYMFTTEPVETSPPKQNAALQPPVIQHNVQNNQGTYWMGIQVPGMLRGYAGKSIQIVIRFVDENGQFLLSNKSDVRYVDASGYVATGTEVIQVTADEFDLSSLQMWMPYASLSLAYTGGKQPYNLNVFAELFSDGKLMMQSSMVPIRVNW